MHVTKEQIDAAKRALGLLPRSVDQPAFNIRPISEAWKWRDRKPAYRTAVANVAYIWRDGSPVDRYGAMPASFEQRRVELRGSGLLLPASAPVWACEGYRIWEEADQMAYATDDPTELSAWHVVMDLPTKLPPARWQDFVTGFVERELTAKGAVVAWAIHAVEAADGSWLVRPHLHLCVTAKMWRHNSRHGRRHIAWLGNWARQRSFELAWRRACRLSEAMRAWRSAPRHKRESNPRNERSFQAT